MSGECTDSQALLSMRTLFSDPLPAAAHKNLLQPHPRGLPLPLPECQYNPITMHRGAWIQPPGSGSPRLQQLVFDCQGCLE